MRANVGDRLVIAGHRVGEGERRGEIVEVKGADGQPPFVVQWQDGHVGVCFPSSDALVERTKAPKQRAAARSR